MDNEQAIEIQPSESSKKGLPSTSRVESSTDKDALIIRLAECERALAEKEYQLSSIVSSRGWKLLSLYYRLRSGLKEFIKQPSQALGTDRDSKPETVKHDNSSPMRVASPRILEGASAEVAQQFSHFRTTGNEAFFCALANHFSRILTSPCLPMYFEFAVTSNDRGRSVASILRKHTTLSGKRYMDMGCAYGGFLVAFAEQGSQVVGIDYDQVLLGLARHNLSDNSLDAPLLLRDATRSSDLQEFRNGFDIVTCNDVIEHVDDPLALVLNVADTMRGGATAYFEIPNRYYPSFVTSDGHYQLFGITLLDYEEANEYYGYSAPGVAYAVRHYLTIDQYIDLFERAGLRLEVLPESFEYTSLTSVLNDLDNLRAQAKLLIGNVPLAIRDRVSERLSAYFEEIQHWPRASTEEEQKFMLRYGAGFWKVLVTKDRSA